jgi:hypothetical protein
MYNIINYDKIRNQINEGDVLLFRGTGKISKIVSAPSETTYSHVGIASWINGNANTEEGILECIEFREGSFIAGLFNSNAAGGGRAVNLSQSVQKYKNQIDVYRPTSQFQKIVFHNETQTVITYVKEFDGKKVTHTMRKMTGLPYGWKRILWMAKHKMVILRLFVDKQSLMDDELGEVIYPVCSTAISHSFNSNGYDLVKNRSDEATEPGDIAKSTRLNYLFTLGHE